MVFSFLEIYNQLNLGSTYMANIFESPSILVVTSGISDIILKNYRLNSYTIFKKVPRYITYIVPNIKNTYKKDEFGASPYFSCAGFFSGQNVMISVISLDSFIAAFFWAKQKM